MEKIITKLNYSQTIEFDDYKTTSLLFGPQEKNLQEIAKQNKIKLATRGNSISISGSDKESVVFTIRLLSQLYAVLHSGFPLELKDIIYAISMLNTDKELDLYKFFKENALVVSQKRHISPKTLNQRAYLEALKESDIVFGVGPAGTGKTYLAVAMAISQLLAKRVKRIILTRPAVEAGEKLGFLPGDLVEKVNPYLRPLYDALYDMLEVEKVNSLFESGVIEIAPLAFMRGRTLHDAFIILDEAQNTTPEQMKMFLTRMGFGSKMVITGDITQIDLPKNNTSERSGLVQSLKVLKDINEIKIIKFDSGDVVRHSLVSKIILAYEKFSG